MTVLKIETKNNNMTRNDTSIVSVDIKKIHENNDEDKKSKSKLTFPRITMLIVLILFITTIYTTIKIYKYDDMIVKGNNDKEPTNILPRLLRSKRDTPYECKDCFEKSSEETLLPAAVRCKKNIEKKKDCCELYKKIHELNRVMEEVKEEYNLIEIPCRGKIPEIANDTTLSQDNSLQQGIENSTFKISMELSTPSKDDDQTIKKTLSAQENFMNSKETEFRNVISPTTETSQKEASNIFLKSGENHNHTTTPVKDDDKYEMDPIDFEYEDSYINFPDNFFNENPKNKTHEEHTKKSFLNEDTFNETTTEIMSKSLNESRGNNLSTPLNDKQMYIEINNKNSTSSEDNSTEISNENIVLHSEIKSTSERSEEVDITEDYENVSLSENPEDTLTTLLNEETLTSTSSNTKIIENQNENSDESNPNLKSNEKILSEDNISDSNTNSNEEFIFVSSTQKANEKHLTSEKPESTTQSTVSEGGITNPLESTTTTSVDKINVSILKTEFSTSTENNLMGFESPQRPFSSMDIARNTNEMNLDNIRNNFNEDSDTWELKPKEYFLNNSPIEIKINNSNNDETQLHNDVGNISFKKVDFSNNQFHDSKSDEEKNSSNKFHETTTQNANNIALEEKDLTIEEEKILLGPTRVSPETNDEIEEDSDKSTTAKTSTDNTISSSLQEELPTTSEVNFKFVENHSTTVATDKLLPQNEFHFKHGNSNTPDSTENTNLGSNFQTHKLNSTPPQSGEEFFTQIEEHTTSFVQHEDTKKPSDSFLADHNEVTDNLQEIKNNSHAGYFENAVSSTESNSNRDEVVSSTNMFVVRTSKDVEHRTDENVLSNIGTSSVGFIETSTSFVETEIPFPINKNKQLPEENEEMTTIFYNSQARDVSDIQKKTSEQNETNVENSHKSDSEFRAQDGRNINSRIVNQGLLNPQFETSGSSTAPKGPFENPFQLPAVESSKASHQLTVNTNMMPMCFYGVPNQNTMAYRQPGSITFPKSQYDGSSHDPSVRHGSVAGYESNSGSYPYSGHTAYSSFGYPQMYPSSAGQQAMYNYYYSMMSQPKYSPTSYVNQNPSMMNPYFCTYVPTSSVQFPPVAGFPDFRRLASQHQNFTKLDDTENNNDIIMRTAELLRKSNISRGSGNCPTGHKQCFDGSKCIKVKQWCDGNVNCKDSSDEFGCSCRKRVDKSRICDGYFDCPNGEDELGCFGCTELEFSCDDWTERRKVATCVPLNERCDGVAQCQSGKDEMDCSLLTTTISTNQTFTTSRSDGYLYRNYRGNWYPVCNNNEDWILDACLAEVGPQSAFPIIHLVPISSDYSGKFLSSTREKGIQVQQICETGEAVHVLCSPIPCGTRVIPPPNHFRKHEVDTSAEDEFLPVVNRLKRFTTKRVRNRDEAASIFRSLVQDRSREKRADDRIVGGRPSQPTSWPWVVAIYRDGFFHCGGVLMSEIWVITAAHCVDTFWQHYYEVQAGMLRRFSFSPMEQNRKVSHIIGHQMYDRADMKNDLALLKMSKPFHFNRWVRPICLPSERSAGPNWLWGPEPGTTCTAVGWGATIEHGPDPDHIREVEVPILARCKHREDQEGQEICAGLLEGGRDACQGDSGGPLLCRNPMAPSQWYVAGIVSHGEGCARPDEPGAYTRVSLYLNWIARSILDENLPDRRPLQKCPGMVCAGIGRCVSKKRRCDNVVDCLAGDDELNCHGSISFSALIKHAMDSMMLFSTNTEYTTENQEDIEATEPANRTTKWTATTTNNDKVDNKEQIITIEKEHTTESDSISRITFTSNSGQAVPMNRNGGIRTRGPTRRPTAPRISDDVALVSNVTTTQATVAYTTTTTTTTTTTAITDDYVFTPPDAIQATPTPPPNDQPTIFLCKHFPQVISISQRCNKALDCEDGTDEEDCTCRDYLYTTHPSSICDGTLDCDDGTDEKDCIQCNENEYQCQLSKQCVKKSIQCDHKPDCRFGEDEWDCFALTNGKQINIDKDQRPELRRKGIVTISKSGKWYPLCKTDWFHFAPDIAGDMCIYLGFNEYKKYFVSHVRVSSLLIIDANGKIEASDKEGNGTCEALYVKCSSYLSTDANTQKIHTAHQSGTNTLKELFTSPWYAAVFIDGKYKCSGTLVDMEWVITSRHCVTNVDAQMNYVAIVFGLGRGNINVMGPHEQIIVANQIISLTNYDLVLLRLSQPVHFTRYSRPLYIKNMKDIVTEKESCVAMGPNADHSTESIFLKPILSKCQAGQRCFKRVTPLFDCSNENNTKAWSGCIVCLSASGWYPAAVYHDSKGLCGFRHPTGYTSIRYLRPNIIQAINEQPFQVTPPICNGVRCPLGGCIESHRICDGISDCEDGSDESQENCDQKSRVCTELGNCECSKTELKCANGKCVAKSAFCDRKDDCGDLSDEPPVCNCSSYLALVAPTKLCDTITNCYDKSDESPRLCPPNDKNYKCEGSNLYIPHEFICDGQDDCPEKDDEKGCLALKAREGDRDGVGELVVRTHGLWHSYCVTESPTPLQLEEICEELNFGRNHAAMINTTVNNEPASVIRIDDFSFVKLNKYIRIFLRGNYPLATLFQTTNCQKLYLECT